MRKIHRWAVVAGHVRLALALTLGPVITYTARRSRFASPSTGRGTQTLWRTRSHAPAFCRRRPRDPFPHNHRVAGSDGAHVGRRRASRSICPRPAAAHRRVCAATGGRRQDSRRCGHAGAGRTCRVPQGLRLPRPHHASPSERTTSSALPLKPRPSPPSPS